MNIELTPNTTVVHMDTNQKGRLLGPLVRQGERMWTVYWEDGETTTIPEAEIAGG